MFTHKKKKEKIKRTLKRENEPLLMLMCSSLSVVCLFFLVAVAGGIEKGNLTKSIAFGSVFFFSISIDSKGLIFSLTFVVVGKITLAFQGLQNKLPNSSNF